MDLELNLTDDEIDMMNEMFSEVIGRMREAGESYPGELETAVGLRRKFDRAMMAPR